jgi:Fe-S cluster assembly protein SufD
MKTEKEITSPNWVIEHFNTFEAALNGQKSLPIHVIRKHGMEKFRSLGIPSQSLESWKYTNLRHFNTLPLSLLSNSSAKQSVKDVALPSMYEDLSGIAIRMVFINGFYSSELSDDKGSLKIDNLAAIVHNPKHELYSFANENINKLAKVDESAFIALNSAFLIDGLALKIEKSEKVEKPIYILNVTTKTNTINYPRVLVNAEEGSEVNIYHHYYSESDVEYVTNAVAEFNCGKKSDVSYTVLQEEAASATHINSIDSTQGEASTFKTVSLSFGSKLARNEVRPVLNAEKCFTEMLGLSVLDTNQHVDNSTIIDHAMPSCESNELYKGVYADKSKGIFSGTIIVRQDAQLTNAIQSSQGLLISDNSACYSRPQLKIWADDVKCTHGATVGQLDEDALFYLRARGIKPNQAKAILIKAFMHEVISKLELDKIEEYVEAKMFSKLDKAIAVA